MGRPINKKFFGNRNIGSASTSTDNGIGGEGVASVVLNALGNYTTRPTFTFSAPQIPGGVTATGTITSEASTVAADGTLLNGVNYVVGDLVTFAGITGVVGRVATVGTGQKEIQAIDFVGTGTNRGSFTTLPTNKTTLAVTVTGNVYGGSGSTGSGQTVAITFRAKSVVITEKGSGYSAAPTSTPTQSVTFTSVALTTDSGAVGSSTNQENAINGVAYLKAVDGGVSAKTFDIVKQEASHRYQVTTADGRGQCKLVAAAPNAGEMTIIATDANGNTYYVTKLTARKALLTRKTQSGSNAWVFGVLDSQTGTYIDYARWTLGSAVGTDKTLSTTKVSVANA
jgi:hypothetical protein